MAVWGRKSYNKLLLMRREAKGERELSLLALGALESGASAGAEGAHRLGFMRAGEKNKAVGQGVVKVTAS